MSSLNDPVRIAIIGAGIGGLALAIGLRRQGVPFTLYEAAAEFSAVGAGISFGPNALKALEVIDPSLRELYNGISRGNGTPGKEHVFFDLLSANESFGFSPTSTGIPVTYPYYTKSSAHRKDLLDVMKSLIAESSVRFGKRAVSFKQVENKVLVTFADGDTIEADAVIGSDGGKGASRRAVLEEYPEEILATYSGRYAYRGIVPMNEAREILGDLAGDGNMFLGSGTYFTTYQMSNGTQLNFLAGRQDKTPWTYNEWTHETPPEVVLKEFEGSDPRLLKLLEYAKPLKWALFHHLGTPTYHRGRICLLGDSAHLSSPHQGAAAGQCLEDAVILSRLLGLAMKSQSPNLTAAFEVYDSIRRPRAQAIVTTSNQAGNMYCLKDPEYKDNIKRIAQDLNERFHWIWKHNLEGDIERAEADYKNQTVSTEE